MYDSEKVCEESCPLDEFTITRAGLPGQNGFGVKKNVAMQNVTQIIYCEACIASD